MRKGLHFALIGEKVQYSRSPRIFEAIFDHIGRAGQFELCSVEQTQLQVCVRDLIARRVNGFSVTIPHKQAVVEYLDNIDPVAMTLKAVNSVAIRDNQCYGFNTDCYGVTFSLRRHNVTAGAGPALIYGYGGAARAVVCALYHDLRIGQFVVKGRSGARAEAFCDDMRRAMPGLEISAESNSDHPKPGSPSPGIVVNCTPLGGANQPTAMPFSDAVDWSEVKCYFDLNYNSDNRSIAAMREQSIPVVNGSEMLVAQALKSFEIWTGQKVEFDPIYQAVFGTDS